jgi:vacuolar-type H+-ATPase subunit H
MTKEVIKQSDQNRSKRMFGVLVGTLNKIKQESGQPLSEAALKRLEIEKKLQQKIHQEKLELANRIQKEADEKRQKLLLQRKEEDSARLQQMVSLCIIIFSRNQLLKLIIYKFKITFQPKHHPQFSFFQNIIMKLL